MSLTPETIEALREAWLNPPHLTWDEYVKAIDEFNRRLPPYRDVPKWDEPFEL